MSQDFPVPRQDGFPRLDGPGDRAAPAAEAGPVSADTPDGTVGVVSLGGRAGGGWTGRVLGRLHRDGRPVPVAAALGALAIFGSLVEDWTVIHLPTEGGTDPDALGEVASGVAELLTFGPAYLLGILVVTACLALVLFGSPGIRHNARVAGLAAAGVVLGFLIAIATFLSDDASRRWDGYGQLEGLTTEHGRGLVLAFVGTGLFGLALLLAGPFVRAAGAATPPPTAGAGTTDAALASDWPWYRPPRTRRAEPDDDDREAPIDLTVTPTKPFVP